MIEPTDLMLYIENYLDNCTTEELVQLYNYLFHADIQLEDVQHG